jgi:Cellulose binding domain
MTRRRGAGTHLGVPGNSDAPIIKHQGVAVGSPRSSRRGGVVVSALVVVALAAAAVVYGAWHSTRTPTRPAAQQADAPLTVRYRTGGPAGATVAKPWLEVINTSDQPVALSDVTLRYYFSADGGTYAANCVQTSLHCASVTETITPVPQPLPTASHYLQVGFTTAAGTLAPGTSTEAIGLQLYRLDHQALNQANDLSFDETVTHYAPSSHITAYLRGVLAWGQAPESSAPAQAAPAPPVPDGVLFDDFHYTDGADPALAANGWTARSDGGGPGIDGTWSTDAVSFPTDAKAQGGQVLQLSTGSDGTPAGTRQAELVGTGNTFRTGTLAARVFFTDSPVSGRTGDHVIESFSTISPSPTSQQYSELDYEYQPNGGWGAPGPKLDTTSWRSAVAGDRATRASHGSLAGWHTVMLTAVDGTATYSIDGRTVFRSSGTAYPREDMRIHFSTWLIDLPFAGQRSWNMRVNWIYAQSGQALSVSAVTNAVDGLYASGTHYLNTTRHS